MFIHCCALSDNYQTGMLLRKVFLQDLWPHWLFVPHSTLLLIRVPYGSIRRIWCFWSSPLSNRHVLTISYLLQSTHSTQQDMLWYLVGIGNSTNCLEGWDSSWLVPLQMMANLSGCKPVNSEALMYCLWDKHEVEILAINNMGRIMWLRGWETGKYGTTSSYYSKQISLLLHLGAFSVLGAKQTAR